jgi:hypothetical protein
MSAIPTRSSALASVGVLVSLGVLALAPAAGAVPAPASTLDEAKLAKVIGGDLRRSLPDADVSVTCQANVPIENGRKSTCTATIDGQKLVYNVKQTSGDGDVTYKRTKAVIDLDKAQSSIAKQVAQQMGGKWKVRCTVAGTSRVYVIAVKKTFSCPISGKDGDGVSRKGKIVYFVKNLQGDVTWEAK